MGSNWMMTDDEEGDVGENKAKVVSEINSKSKLSLPPPKNDGDEGPEDEENGDGLFVIDKTGQTGNTVLGFKSKLQLPPPKNIEKDNNSPKRKAEDVPSSEEKEVK